MGYPGELFILDEGKLSKWIAELNEKGIEYFMEKHGNELKSDEGKTIPKYYLEDIPQYFEKFKSGKKHYGENILAILIEFSGAEKIDLYEFNHFEYLDMLDYIKKRNIKLTYDPDNPIEKNKGIEIFELLFDGTKELLGLPANMDVGGVKSYVDADTIQKSGKEAIELLKKLEINEETVIEMSRLSGEMPDRLIKSLTGRFSSSRDKIVKAIETAMAKKYGMALLAR